jgi:hypothetical protein
MPLPYARSIAEEHMYMQLHPCECGETAATGRRHATIQAEQGLASEHAFGCAGCGQQRRFVFRLPGLAPRHADRYGGPEPSQIIDAGEWRLVSLAYLGERERIRHQPDQLRAVLEEVLAACQEMLKFIPPGESAIPGTAFFTDRGLRARASEQAGAFTRSYLEAMTDSVQRDLTAAR